MNKIIRYRDSSIVEWIRMGARKKLSFHNQKTTSLQLLFCLSPLREVTLSCQVSRSVGNWNEKTSVLQPSVQVRCQSVRAHARTSRRAFAFSIANRPAACNVTTACQRRVQKYAIYVFTSFHRQSRPSEVRKGVLFVLFNKLVWNSKMESLKLYSMM